MIIDVIDGIWGIGKEKREANSNLRYEITIAKKQVG